MRAFKSQPFLIEEQEILTEKLNKLKIDKKKYTGIDYFYKDGMSLDDYKKLWPGLRQPIEFVDFDFRVGYHRQFVNGFEFAKMHNQFDVHANGKFGATN